MFPPPCVPSQVEPRPRLVVRLINDGEMSFRRIGRESFEDLVFEANHEFKIDDPINPRFFATIRGQPFTHGESPRITSNAEWYDYLGRNFSPEHQEFVLYFTSDHKTPPSSPQRPSTPPYSIHKRFGGLGVAVSVASTPASKKPTKTIVSEVKQRDGCKCVVCGKETKLEEAHIFNAFASEFDVWFPVAGIERHNDKRNLITLCKDCHDDFDRRLFLFLQLEDNPASFHAKPLTSDDKIISKLASCVVTYPDPNEVPSDDLFLVRTLMFFWDIKCPFCKRRFRGYNQIDGGALRTHISAKHPDQRIDPPVPLPICSCNLTFDNWDELVEHAIEVHPSDFGFEH